MNANHSDFLTPHEAVSLLPETSYQSLLRWAREGKVPFVELPGGRKFFRRSDIEGLLEPRRGGVSRQAEVPRGGGQSRARAGASRSSSPASSSVSAVSASVGGGLW